MNFIDLCVACGRAIGRGCKVVGRWLAELLRVTYRKWWLVLPVMVLTLAAGFYYSRTENLKYKVRAIALLNGPSIAQFDQRYAMLQAGQSLPADEPIAHAIWGRKIADLRTFRVIDVYDDAVMDYIDLKMKSHPTDTVNVQMQDRLCLQFTMKKRDLHMLPQVEEAMLAYLNNDQAMQRAFALYRPNLEREIKFNHDQVEKLDSLTSQYYFHTNPGQAPLNTVRQGLLMMGDWKVRLFLDDIYKQQARTQHMDQRAELAVAPVVLENHFALVPAPLNSRRRCLPIALIVGWLAGCLLAELIEKRKALSAWLKA